MRWIWVPARLRLEPEETTSPDLSGKILVQPHRLPESSDPVSSLSPSTGTLLRLVIFPLTDASRRIHRWVREQANYSALQKLSDAQLKDIGIDRSEIRFAAACPQGFHDQRKRPAHASKPPRQRRADPA